MVRPRARDTEFALGLTSAPRRGVARGGSARPGVVGASCLETGECQWVSREQCECLDSALPRPRTPVCTLYAAVGLPLTHACASLLFTYGITAVRASDVHRSNRIDRILTHAI